MNIRAVLHHQDPKVSRIAQVEAVVEKGSLYVPPKVIMNDGLEIRAFEFYKLRKNVAWYHEVALDPVLIPTPRTPVPPVGSGGYA